MVYIKCLILIQCGIGVGIMGQKVMDCPMLNAASGISLSCRSPGNVTMDCFKPLSPGTTVDYRCAEFYRPLLGRAIPRQLQCRTNGIWTNFKRFQEYLCEVECGKPVRPHTPFIALGQDTLRYSWPWHATIFFLSLKTSMYYYICGGSLISQTMVLTAAHCIVPSADFPLSNYYIVFGAISSNWTDNLSDVHVQRIKIIKAMIPEEYESRDYRSDIALLELESPVKLSRTVSPVCFPYDNDFAKPEHPEVIGEGEVVGYGKDENGKYQLHLKYTKLPVVGAAKCYSVLDKLPGREQFCAGIVNGSAVCPGDSGGGMVFKGHGVSRYYIQGIVSNSLLSRGKDTCDGLSYFTNVNYFARWVADIIDTSDSDSGEDEDIGKSKTATTKTGILFQSSTASPGSETKIASSSTETAQEVTTSEMDSIFVNNSTAENILDICERSCSHYEGENKTFSLKGRENALEYFDKLGHDGSSCELLCFELDYVEVMAGQLIASLEECKKLESICLTNIKLVGQIKQKIELPALKEFKMTSVVIESFYADDVYSRIFFYKVDPWPLNQVTHLSTNIEIASRNYRDEMSTALLVHWQKKKIVLHLGSSECDDILEMRASELVLEDLELTNCEFRAPIIPSTLTRLVLMNFKIHQGSLATLVRRQTNLGKLVASTNEKYALDVLELPKKVKKVLCSEQVELKSGLKAGIPEPRISIEDMCVQTFNDRTLLSNFSYIFPNLKQLGIIKANLLLLQQALLRPPPSLMKIGGYDFYLPPSFYEGLPLNSVPGIADIGYSTNFIIERNSSSSKWKAKPSTSEEVSAMC